MRTDPHSIEEHETFLCVSNLTTFKNKVFDIISKGNVYMYF